LAAVTVPSSSADKPSSEEDAMNLDLSARVDAYIEDRLLGADPVLGAVLAANSTAGLRPIDVSAAQGRFLELLVRISGARNILEIGTLGGYSAIAMARTLPEGGRLVTLEYEAAHAAVALKNFEHAGLSHQIVLHLGPAAETLPKLAEAGAGPFDLVFIDADKPNNPGYLDWAVRLSRPGATIILDNVIRDGHVADANSSDRNVRGAQAAFELIRDHKRIDSTALQTVGIKGYDGFIIGIVRPA
jgi:predicted O-methyltransferase YrrM